MLFLEAMDGVDPRVGQLLRKEFEVLVKSSNPEQAWRATMSFCEITVREQHGPVAAVKLLSTGMQSTEESVALKSLEVLETAVRRCGPRFQTEVGKFRFLNEIVKLVSPRYLGKRTSEKIKGKAIEILFVWTQLLPHEAKIKEAYDMLKAQKLITEDPDVPLCTDVLSEDGSAGASPVVGSSGDSAATTKSEESAKRLTGDIFNDDERTQKLKRLLQSKNPRDLQEANKLIKKIVSEDEQKQAKASWRTSELGRVQTIVGVLSDMLSAYQPSLSVEEKDTLKQLYASCKELRSGLPQIANQTDDGEKDALVNIVKASEDLDAVMKDYEFIVEGKGSPSARRKFETQNGASDPTALLDLDLLSLSMDSYDASLEEKPSELTGDPSQLLEEVFGTNPRVTNGENLPFGLAATVSTSHAPFSGFGLSGNDSRFSRPSGGIEKGFEMGGGVTIKKSHSKNEKTNNAETKSSNPMSVFEDIEKMARSSLPLGTNKNASVAPTKSVAEVVSSEIPPKSDHNRTSPVNEVEFKKVEKELSEPVPSDSSREKSLTVSRPSKSLDSLTYSLDDVVPSDCEPKELVKTADVTLTISSSTIENDPELSVGVLAFANRSKSPITDYVFTAVVTPKTVPVKLLPPSDVSLPPCRPFVPPPVITQLLLVSNPSKVPISVKFVLTFTKDDDLLMERGTLPNFVL